MDAGRLGPGVALAAAVLFGLSAPAAKLLAGAVDAWLLAGLLYLGSGVGLGFYRLTQRLLGRVGSEAPLGRQDLPGSAEPLPSAASSAPCCSCTASPPGR